jgi:DNA-binding response OmpR family regulator
MKLILVEDDLQLGKALAAALANTEFVPTWVRRVVDAKDLLSRNEFALALFDIGLPDGSGLDLLEWLRAQGSRLPVMMLTARDTVDDRVRGLDSGADDYLPKPFAVPELLSRLRALYRRSAGFVEQVWRVGDLSVEPARQHASVAGETLDLSLREYTLLVELARNAGRVVTRTALERTLFAGDAGVESNALEVHVHHLRRKVGSNRIRTLRGVGYMLEE